MRDELAPLRFALRVPVIPGDASGAVDTLRTGIGEPDARHGHWCDRQEFFSKFDNRRMPAMIDEMTVGQFPHLIGTGCNQTLLAVS